MKEEVVYTIGERIKQLRKSLGLTQQEFADRINMKQNSIANYEIGRNDPIDAVLSLICREYRVNEAWLRAGEGEMFAPAKDSLLDQLAEQYRLSDTGRRVLEVYISMSDSQRDVLDLFVRRLSDVPQEDFVTLRAIAHGGETYEGRISQAEADEAARLMDEIDPTPEDFDDL